MCPVSAGLGSSLLIGGSLGEKQKVN